jgi:hypothetical protein
MAEPYIHVTVTKTHDPVQDILHIGMNQTAAVQLKDLLARALNCLPHDQYKDWYELADRLDEYSKRNPRQATLFNEYGEGFPR